MSEDTWDKYLESLKRLEAAVKLTVFWTRETAKLTRETCDQADIVVKGSKKFINEPKVELETTEELVRKLEGLIS